MSEDDPDSPLKMSVMLFSHWYRVVGIWLTSCFAPLIALTTPSSSMFRSRSIFVR